MPKIFISYRRDESAGYAGRIHERLVSAYGADAVFMDVDDIRPGADFVRAIEEQVSSSQVLLVLIGKRWLAAENSAGQRRLDDPNDFVRIEIAKALAGHVRVIPVLLNNVSMPSEKDLPGDIKELARHQAVELSEERWDYDFSQLAKTLGGSRQKTRNRLIAATAASAVIALAVLLWTLYGRHPDIDVSGRWSADVRYEFAQTVVENFVFEKIGRDIRGTASFLKVNYAIEDGRMDLDRFSFVTRTFETAGGENRQATHRYLGSVVGDEIRFIMQTEGGFSTHPPISFVAKRQRLASVPSGLIVKLPARFGGLS